ncbi:MAG: alkaline shock response membrane anchor protein AmaP [Nocardia sp.]|nr:alkaline shock response membrane anchor protein AmaP [Nocardia sp.]NUS91617.1 alkaline shock response membrane anchor protein AmaP [Nocardia sp.]
MARSNHPAIANRAVLAVLGAVLATVGGLALAAHFDRLNWVDTDARLVPGTAAPPTWVFVAVIAGAAVLALLCLRWLFAQAFRMPASRTWRIEADGAAGRTTVASRTAAAPVAADIEEFPGVRSASAWLTGSRETPELFLVVTAEPDADMAALRQRIADDAVTDLRHALEIDEIAVELELRVADAARPARLR